MKLSVILTDWFGRVGLKVQVLITVESYLCFCGVRNKKVMFVKKNSYRFGIMVIGSVDVGSVTRSVRTKPMSKNCNKTELSRLY